MLNPTTVRAFQGITKSTTAHLGDPQFVRRTPVERFGPSPKFTRRFGINFNHTLAETFPFTDDTPCEMNWQTLRQRRDGMIVKRSSDITRFLRLISAVGTRTPTGQPVVGESTFFFSKPSGISDTVDEVSSSMCERSMRTSARFVI